MIRTGISCEGAERWKLRKEGARCGLGGEVAGEGGAFVLSNWWVGLGRVEGGTEIRLGGGGSWVVGVAGEAEGWGRGQREAEGQ